MQVLTQLAALLREGDQYTIRLRGTKDGTQVVIEAAIAHVNPDEPNEALRNVQAALALPLFVTIPREESISIVLPKALDSYIGAKANAVEARDLLTSAIQKAANAAKAAAIKPVAPKGSKTTSVAPVEAEGKGDAPDGEEEGAAPATVDAGAPAPAASVFDGN